MFGSKKHEAVASISMIILLILGITSLISSFVDIGVDFGWTGWLFWALILYLIIKIKHPPVPYFEKLDPVRMFWGYIAIVIFLLSFSPTPFVISF
jgi:hypothetical protein